MKSTSHSVAADRLLQSTTRTTTTTHMTANAFVKVPDGEGAAFCTPLDATSTEIKISLSKSLGEKLSHEYTYFWLLDDFNPSI